MFVTSSLPTGGLAAAPGSCRFTVLRPFADPAPARDHTGQGLGVRHTGSPVPFEVVPAPSISETGRRKPSGYKPGDTAEPCRRRSRGLVTAVGTAGRKIARNPAATATPAAVPGSRGQRLTVGDLIDKRLSIRVLFRRRTCNEEAAQPVCRHRGGLLGHRAFGQPLQRNLN